MKKSFCEKYGSLLIPLLFFLGFLLGVVWMCISRDCWLTLIDRLEPDFLWKIEQIEVDKRALFFLTVGKRLGALFWFWLLSYSLFRVPLTLGFFFYHGICVGMIMELLSIRYQVRGLLFYLGMVLPHGLFYALGFGLSGVIFLKRRKDKTLEGKERGKRISGGIAWAAVLAGIFMESYINPELLKIMVGFLLE